jgi:DNA mismatch repair protein MutS
MWLAVRELPDLVKKLKDIFEKADVTWTTKAMLFGGLGALLGIAAYMAYSGINEAKLENNITTYIQERLIGVATTVRAMKEIAHITKSNEVLSQYISTKEINKLEKKTAQLTKLIKLLMTKTFTGKASFFSLSGRVLAAYKIMNEVKNQITPAFEELGLIDAHYSCAQLMNKFKESNNTYCYPKYITEAKQPCITGKAFWFPGLLNDPKLKKVVTNDVEMGTHKEANILLTGPNAGGKSTILKGIVTAIILAQSIGIAPAAHMALTPFSKIQTYINIVDSASEGISTFRAELNRARDLLNTIIGLNRNQFSFTIFDEVFRGTNPEEAIQGSAYLAAILGKMQNSMSIIATHFGLLTKLEELLPGIYTNYQVTAIKKETCFHYPYTWEPGISRHKIATDLMRFENLRDPDGLSMSERFAKLIDEYGIR